MVIGKMLAYFFVGLADSVIALVVGLAIFSVPFRGSFLLLGLSTCLFLCGVLFWGIFISSGARTQVQAYQMAMLSTFLPGFLLSGFVFAINTMPKVLQIFSLIIPARYFVSTLNALFLKGAGLEVIWEQLVFMAVFAGVVFWLAVRKLKRQRVA
jgi:ABC-2 type transport system permease protein